MSSLLVFNGVYRLEIQSVMLVFSTPLVNCCHSTFSLTSSPPLPPPSQSQRTVYTDSLCLWGGGWGGVELCCRPYSAGIYHSVSDQIHNLQNCYTTQTKAPVKTTFRDWCLYSSFVRAQFHLTLKVWWPYATLFVHFFFFVRYIHS